MKFEEMDKRAGGILNSIMDAAVMQYNNTGDRWRAYEDAKEHLYILVGFNSSIEEFQNSEAWEVVIKELDSRLGE